jgi:hypothetical protein
MPGMALLQGHSQDFLKGVLDSLRAKRARKIYGHGHFL